MSEQKHTPGPWTTEGTVIVDAYFGDEHSRLAEQLEAAIAKAIGR